MIRFIAIIFALVVATSVQAMPVAPLHEPNSMITQVREACGAGRVRINGVCVARTTKRHVRREMRRCARWNPAGVCVRYY
jgi:putative N-acetylmannosamine-6-phosphate epimerase